LRSPTANRWRWRACGYRAHARRTLVHVASDRQARGDLYAIQDEIECVKAQLARLPTRAYFNRTLLMATASIWALLGAVALLMW
jgi:hypothetical protein